MIAALLQERLDQPNFGLRVVHDQHFLQHSRTSTQIPAKINATPQPPLALVSRSATTLQTPFVCFSYEHDRRSSRPPDQPFRSRLRLSLRFFLTPPPLCRQ